MLAALFAPAVIKALFSEGAHLFEQYQQKQITLAELANKLSVIAMQEATKIEQANADMVAKTYASFSQMVMSSRLVQVVYAIVTLSQCFVLFWSEWAVPMLVWKYGGSYPSSGDLTQWAYGLLVLLVGGGMVAIKRPAQDAPKLPK